MVAALTVLEVYVLISLSWGWSAPAPDLDLGPGIRLDTEVGYVDAQPAVLHWSPEVGFWASSAADVRAATVP